METKADYFNEVLGISLKGSSVAMAATDVVVEATERSQFLFYVDSEDFEINKDLVQKILKAVQKNDGIVITNLADVKKINPLEVFTFGEAIELMGIKVQSFPSFSEIANSSELKARLWSELKARI